MATPRSSKKSTPRRATAKQEPAAPAETFKIHIELKFQDKNQPSICADVDTMDEAKTEVSIMLNRYAAIKCFWITDTDGDTVHVFDHAGNYCWSHSKKALERISTKSV